MSFDIFLACVRNGKPAPIPREVFDPIFGRMTPTRVCAKRALAPWRSNIRMAVALRSTVAALRIAETQVIR
jgi:hypothetical protein